MLSSLQVVISWECWHLHHVLCTWWEMLSVPMRKCVTGHLSKELDELSGILFLKIQTCGLIFGCVPTTMVQWVTVWKITVGVFRTMWLGKRSRFPSRDRTSKSFLSPKLLLSNQTWLLQNDILCFMLITQAFLIIILLMWNLEATRFYILGLSNDYLAEEIWFQLMRRWFKLEMNLTVALPFWHVYCTFLGIILYTLM